MDETLKTSNTLSSLTIQLPQFEGPLDLLLYLIRKEEMDIMDIQIHKITNQYMDYIKLMKEFDLEIAGEFIAMAATLIQIKSRMLLPQYDENGEVIETEDPRKELVQRLLEYQKYQEVGRTLYERPLLGRDTWSRGQKEKLEAKEEDIVLDENPLFSLISAYRTALKSAKKKVHQVTARLQSIASRILEIKDRLIVGQKVALSDLVTEVEGRRKQILITFLSVLELGKMGIISLFQADNYQEIYVEAKMAVQTDVISKVEEYDNIHSLDTAQALIDESESIMALHPEDNQIVEKIINDEAIDQEELEVAFGSATEMASDEEIALAEQELKEDHSENALIEGEV